MNTDLMFSSKTDNWSTPQDFFDKLNKEFHFTLDPCATHENHKCNHYFTKDDNGLAQDWSGETVFCNPPYGKSLKAWVEKCYEESKKGTVIVMLIPSRTDTQYFHQYIYPFWINKDMDKDVIYATGIIDGEGCVSLQKRNPTETNRLKNPSYSLRISVKMTCKKTVDKMNTIFKCGNIFKEKREPDFKDCYKWEAVGEDAFNVLLQIYSMSITKKDQIFNAMEYFVQEKTEDNKQYYYELLRNLKKQSSDNIVKTEIRFIRGRLKFGGCKNAAPFPSMVVIFR